MGVVATLAVRDAVHDWRLSFCLVLAFAALVAPLLILLGVRTGIVETMRERLLTDPNILEVSIRGNWQLDQAWFNAVREHPSTEFVIPMTRSLSVQADLVVSPTAFVRRAIMTPTAQGDPLLRRVQIEAPQRQTDIVISQSIADKLELVRGDEITLGVSRRFNGENQRANVPVLVTAIAPATIAPRDEFFATLQLLQAIEDYIDGQPEFTFDAAPTRDLFARARVYATSLNEVAPLSDFIRSKNVETATKADEIESLNAIDRSSSFLFNVVGWTTGAGGIAALIGFIVVNVDRRRSEFAILRLMGVSRQLISLYPTLQTTLIAGTGFLVAVAAYKIGEGTINNTLGKSFNQGEQLSRLSVEAFAQAGGVLLIISLSAAALGGVYAMRIDPAESLRDS